MFSSFSFLLSSMWTVFVLQASRFQVQGKALHKKMWWENMRAKAVVIGILIALALIIWLSVCHGFVCS